MLCDFSNLALATYGTTKDLSRHPTSDNPNCLLQHPARPPFASLAIKFHANTHHRRHLPLSSPDNDAMTSRAYFYHLRFELFPKPPTTFVDRTAPDVDDQTRLPSIPVSFSDSLRNHFKLPVAEDKHHRATTNSKPTNESRHATDITDALNTVWAIDFQFDSTTDGRPVKMRMRRAF